MSSTAPPRRFADPHEVILTLGGPVTVGELQKRCELLEPGIVLVREAPYSNAEVFQVFIETVQDLGGETFAIVNDLGEAKTRPRREHQKAIVDALNSVGVHWSIVQPGSAFLRTVARFIMARVSRGNSSSSVHENMSEAIQAARAALAKHKANAAKVKQAP